MGKSLFAAGIASVALFAAPATDNHAELFQAIRNGDAGAIRRALSGDTREARDSRGATPLMHAAAFGSIDAMKALIEAGADVNAKNNFGATALLWCARDGEKARMLIEHGADVNVQSKQGRTPLMLASMREGGADIVALLLSKGADVNAADTHGETALGLAAEYGGIDNVRLLIGKKASIHSLNQKGQTPLILAAQGGPTRGRAISDPQGSRCQCGDKLVYNRSQRTDPVVATDGAPSCGAVGLTRAGTGISSGRRQRERNGQPRVRAFSVCHRTGTAES